MRRLSKFIALSALVALSGLAGAISWADKTVPDPIDPGKTCAVREPMSWGGYIYQFPSKYDMVFWPFTDENGLWVCADSGYVSFMPGFKTLSDAERSAIAAFLKGRDKPTDARARLVQLEAIEALRTRDPEARNELLRTLARRYQDLGDVARANEYRKTALAQIVARLDSPLPDFKHLEYLYLAANYTRLFGDTAASDAWLAKLATAIAAVKDPEARDAADYLKKLSADTVRIQPGGVLDPAPLPRQ